jgi:hypothetical protein
MKIRYCKLFNLLASWHEECKETIHKIVTNNKNPYKTLLKILLKKKKKTCLITTVINSTKKQFVRNFGTNEPKAAFCMVPCGKQHAEEIYPHKSFTYK